MTSLPPEQVAANAERRVKYHEADVVVVGAGIFGCGVAHALAEQGRSVILLERWMHEPDRIVGELLQPGGVQALRKLGLGKCIEGIDAVPCYGYHVIYHGEEVVLPYPSVNGPGSLNTIKMAEGFMRSEDANRQANGAVNGVAKTETLKVQTLDQATDAVGWCFHHGRFIMKLREACRNHANITMFETEVTAAITGENSSEVLGVESRTTDKETSEKKADYFFGQLNIICDGYASKFRKGFLGRSPVVLSKFYGLELIDCPFPPAGFGHVVIGKGYPVLFYQIGSHETRALIDVPERLAAASPANGGVRGYIKKVVAPNLPPEVSRCLVRALNLGKTLRSMPNSRLPSVRQGHVPGVLVVGDAYNMRHPLTGGGMTVAFNDCVLLAELLDPKIVPSLGHRRAMRAAAKQFHWRRKSLTSIINVLAMALYALFAAEDRQLRALQKGCFAYFEAGFAAEPMGLMGGMIRKPMLLAFHFFSVAFLAICINAKDICGHSVAGLWKAPLALLDAILILWTACVVFLPAFWAELQ